MCNAPPHHPPQLKSGTRATLNAKIPSAAWISIHAEGWDCETVRTVKQSRYLSMCRWWRPWNSLAREAVLLLMALWWLYDGHVFPVAMKPEILIFYVKFDLEGHGWPTNNTVGNLTKVFCTSVPNWVILAWVGDELLRGQTSSSELGKIWLQS